MVKLHSGKPRILVVDDVAENLHSLINILSDEYAVIAATSGKKTLQLAARKPGPDLILLDIRMPDMDGYEVLRQLKANPATAAIPVIFVTMLSDEGHEAKALDLGAADYITKPVNPAIALMRVHNQIALTQSINKLRLTLKIFEHTTESILITDADRNIVDVNPAFIESMGYSREEVLGKNPRLLQSGKHDQMFYAAMWQAINNTGYWRDEIWNRDKSGAIHPKLHTILAIRDEQGQVSNYVGISSDITQLKQRETRLAHSALHDEMTGLPNRTLFFDRLQKAIEQSDRNKQLLAICYLDLNGFKAINDRISHQAGDMVLTEVARRINETMRGIDTAARLGGDEFAILLLGLDKIEEVTPILNRLSEAIAKPMSLDQMQLSVSASIGISIYPNDSKDSSTLLTLADQAMYAAKRSHIPYLFHASPP
jgi:diguanylate cyclase (GGDEF)-like protein/PAS domain S-box-containing protein